MKEVVILVPEIKGGENMEIEVKASSQSKPIRYRMEMLCPDSSSGNSTDRVSIIRSRINELGSEWELVHMGDPQNECVSLMFRMKNGHPRD